MLALAAVGIVAIYVYPTSAQQVTTSTPTTWSDRATLTGDWGGTRSTLEAAGIKLRATFLTESAVNPVGGRRQTARYTQEVNFGADLDLSRLIGDPGGRVQITFLDRVGRSLSADAIGNLFAVQQLYGAGLNFRIAELNYQQSLFTDRLSFKLGWAPAGDDFASLPVFCDFQSGFICGHPNPMTTNSGAHNYPTGQWGARIMLRPTRALYLQSAIYQVNPNQGNSDKGLDLGFSGTGAFVPVEFGWLPGNDAGKFPGIYKIGGYYNSSNAPDVLQDIHGMSAGLTGAPFIGHNGRFGTYGMADQVIERDSSDSRRFMRIGALGGIADRATATFRYFLAAGGIRQGTFKHRDADYIAVLFAYARTNPRLTRYQEDRDTTAPGSVGVQTYESVAEIDYNVQVTPWLSVRPNLQYILHPGATGQIPNAFVIGLHTGVTF